MSGGGRVSAGIELIGRWAHWLELTERAAPKTRHAYKVALVRWIADALPPDLRTVTEDDILAYIETLARHGSTRGDFLRAASSFYGWAAPRGYAVSDPTLDFRIKRSRSPRVKFFTPEEMRAFFAAAADIPDDRALPTCLLMFGTAARVGSVEAAMPEDVDLEARTILWRVAKNNRPYESALHEAHSLPAAARLLDLQGYHPKHGIHRGTLVGVGAESIRKWVKRAGQKAGLPSDKSVPHTLRRTMGTLMAQANVPLVDWMAVLNHATPSEFSRYAGTTTDRIREAVGSVNLVVVGGGGATRA